ncbi:peptidylprolyl isomerase [Bombiscardovia apis]|uniref:peptidylprolyl isomerase n=1 Tax=Bombiscardovia apis TaxID=2932182 RepID=A0ABM8BAV6_9BIFI|nr:FKBP-type peptidyl-prolyl cis-trans isomerase [Bombiscardovia apis]BDR54053.1 peptidylprolyl isomerase [Bombiscardovia apis]
MNSHNFRPILKGVALLSTLALGMSLASCGNPPNPTPSQMKSDSNQSTKKGPALIGVTAEGKLGQKPKINFKTPFKVTDKSSAVLQEGDGEALKDGDRLCVRSVAVSAKDGKELDSTWEKGEPDCQIVVNEKSYPAYYDQFIKMKVNGTIGVGIDDNTAANKDTNSYIMALTVVSKSKALTRAEGKAVTDIPSNLPKITLDSTGKPSIDLNGYQPPAGRLVVQPLIKGDGPEVKSTQSVSAHYTGWLASDGKQFDSSWDKGQPADFSLDGVVKGWKEGLSGQTVGSQVLLVIPPELGYGKEAKSGIPANSTLIFVVDILSAY